MLSGSELLTKCNGDVAINAANSFSQEYLEANTRTFQDINDLTPNDLVLLYQNADADAHRLSATSGINWRGSNDYVETVVHHDNDDPVSEISSSCSLDDINNIFVINNERLDLLNNPSFEMSLAHKNGCLDFERFDLAPNFEPNFLLKDSYKHFRILNNMTMELENYELPKSLLDYIYCKRLEDNYSFDMNNIIIYVKNTIEQLKCISNGEYLSEKAKEKWHEVDNSKENINYKDVNLKINKVLANTTSIHLYAERKTTNNVMTWDDIVHSEMDLRSLCKLLEKQIIIQIPKLINCPYILYSKCWTDGVVLRCMKDSKTGKRRTCPRVDVFLQLQRSNSGQLLNNVNSIMVLGKSPLQNFQDTHHLVKSCEANEIRPDNAIEIVELDSKIKEIDNKNISNNSINSNMVKDVILYSNSNESDKENIVQVKEICHESFEPDVTCYNEFPTIDSSTNLMISMKQLNMECTVPEEDEEQVKPLKETSKSNKRKSPTLKTRIKSPYENKSTAVEEKKRRRLLEIRERREKRKLNISENCKMKKNKYGKSFVQAQASSSVTRLSITNKAFYRSIFGDGSSTFNSKTSEFSLKGIKMTAPPTKYKDQEKKEIGSILVNNNNDCNSSISQSSSENIPTFTIEKDLNDDNVVDDSNRELAKNNGEDVFIDKSIKVPNTSPKFTIDKASSKSSILIEFKESINKIYDIINTNKFVTDNNFNRHIETNNIFYPDNSTVLESDSGTSLKNPLSSSITSSHSFNKINTDKSLKMDATKVHLHKGKKNPEPMIPKVVISSKIQSGNQEILKNELIKERKIVNTNSKCKDPLKSISRIIQQIDYIKKNKVNDRSGNKNTVSNNLKNNNNIYNCLDTKENKLSPPVSNKSNNKKSIYYLEKNRKSPTVLLASQFDHINVKHMDNFQDDKITSIIEEAKEARGEAVRGPPRNNSRINYLAQPRKLNVSCNNEQFQHKYGRNFSTNRLQKNSPPQPVKDKNIVTTPNKGNIYFKNNMKVADCNKPIEKPPENNDKILINYHPKFYKSKDNEKKNVSFAKTQEFDRTRKNQDLSLRTGRMNTKTKTVEEPKNLYKNKPENRFTPTNFGFIESSLPKNQALYGLQLHKMVNKILNKTDLNDLPEDSESNTSDIATKQITDIAKQSKDDANKEEDLKMDIIKVDKKEESKKIINLTLPTVIIDEPSILSNTPSEIQTDLQLLSAQGDSLYSNANSLVKIHSNLSRTYSNNIFCDLKLSSTGINFNWPLKHLNFTTLEYAFPNFKVMKPIKKTYLKNTISSTTNTILMIDKPTQVIETVTKMERALQTCFDNTICNEIPIRNLCNESAQCDEIFITDMCQNDNHTILKTTGMHNDSDSTSSLDVLVNLLNEIQSITTCQSEIMKSNTEPFRIYLNNNNEKTENDHFMLRNDDNVLNECENTADVFSNNKSKQKNSKTIIRNTAVIKAGTDHKIVPTQEIDINPFFPVNQSFDSGDFIDSDNELIHIYDNNCNNDIDNIHIDKIILHENKLKLPKIPYESIIGGRSSYCVTDQYLMKIKRDALVTMYSVLIFTVFAALSIPELLNL